MFEGLLGLSLWGLIGSALILTHITIISVTIYLHRHQSHHALTLHPVISHFFRFWLWLTTGIKTREWVAIHRKHHAKCETVDDPHSPQILGLKKVLWQGAELYQTEAKSIQTLEKYGKQTPNDWIEKHLYRYTFLGLAIMLMIDVTLFGIAGVSIWAIQMIWIPFWAAGVINGIGHYFGYRNYECRDASTNLVPWGILIGGEELHNNHHTYASSAKLSSKWWEFDIGWMYIRIFALLKLAKVKKIAPEVNVGEIKPIVDVDTMRAVLTNRFQVMANYSKNVIIPAYNEERKRVSAISRIWFKRGRNALIRNENLLNTADEEALQRVFTMSKKLQMVYSYKLSLQEIWLRTNKTKEPLLNALQEWCTEAENTGIKLLEDFAQSIRSYTLNPSVVNQAGSV